MMIITRRYYIKTLTNWTNYNGAYTLRTQKVIWIQYNIIIILLLFSFGVRAERTNIRGVHFVLAAGKNLPTRNVLFDDDNNYYYDIIILLLYTNKHTTRGVIVGRDEVVFFLPVYV